MSRTRSRPASGGFSLVEMAISVVIVGVMFVAVMYTVGASRVTQYTTEGRNLGSTLAHDLMAEILQQAYEEPGGGGAFGMDAAEGSGTRAGFDDIDDYDAWSASPPELKDGTPIDVPAGWRRKVVVRWVQPTNLTQTSGSETDTKQIIVTALHNEVVMTRIESFRTSAFPDLPP